MKKVEWTEREFEVSDEPTKAADYCIVLRISGSSLDQLAEGAFPVEWRQRMQLKAIPDGDTNLPPIFALELGGRTL